MKVLENLGQNLAGSIWERAVLANLCWLLLKILATALGIYCLADLVLNQRILGGSSPSFLLQHYSCHIIKRLPRLLPFCSLLCVFRLLRYLVRSGEWNALISSGVSIGQISLPFARFGLIASIWGFAAFETLYPIAANNLRVFETSPELRSSLPKILFIDSKNSERDLKLVFTSYRESVQKESSGVYQRGFISSDPKVWIFFETLQFFPGFAQLRNSVQFSFQDQTVKTQQIKTSLLPHDVDVEKLVRQTIPAEDLNLWQLKKETQRSPHNFLPKAYYQYRLLQQLTPFWSIFLAFALFKRAQFQVSIKTAVFGISALLGLDAICQIAVIFSGFHMLRPIWMWLLFIPPLCFWLFNIYSIKFRSLRLDLNKKL